jgi:hypothetical protein
MTIETNSNIFDNIEEFCTNETYTQKSSFMIKGQREKSYFYIRDKHLSGARIAKITDDYAKIVINHTTIDKTPKQNIAVNLSISGEFKISNKRIITKFNDYSDCSKKELDSINEWKNVEHSIRLQKIRARMENWVENLHECWVNESEKRIRAIYITDKQKVQIENATKKSKSTFLNLSGKFKMYADYTTILKKIETLEPTIHR